MIHRLLLIFPFLILFAATGNAQRLRVVDADGHPLAGIEVNSGIKGFTDSNGRVDLPVAAYPVKVQLSGLFFEPATQKIRNNRMKTVVLNAKTNTLRETVVTGVARPMALQNALSNYTVIDRKSIDAIGAVTLADALPTQLNMSLSNDGILGASIRMQGLGSDKVKILIDGLPVNGREAGSIDPGQLNLNNVARIEIVKGPMSVAYGSDAMGGVINLISRKRTNAWDADATFNYETIGKYNLSASVGRKWKRNLLAIGGGRNYFNGWGELDTIAIKRALLFKPKEQYLANASYTYTAPSGFIAGLASDYLWEKVTNKGTLNSYPYTGLAKDQYFYTQRSNTRLTLQNKVGRSGYLTLQNSYAYYKRLRKEVIKNLVNLSDTLSQATGAQDTSLFNDINLRSNYSNHWKKLQYDAGYDVLLQTATSQKFGTDEHHAQNDFALYGNASMNFLNDRLTAQAGIRAAHNSVYKAPVSPAINFLYRASEQLQFRASYARAFRAPTLKELYLEFIDVNHHVTGNPDLKAEHGNHLQASGSWQYKANKVSGQIVITAFYDDVTNMITLAKADTVLISNNYTYSNVAHIRNAIFNLQADASWNNLYVNAGAGLIHTFGEADFSSFNSPELTLNARYFFKEPKLSLSLFYKYTGDTRFASALATGNDLFGGKISPYSLLNVSVERGFFNQRLQLTAGIKNLLNVVLYSSVTSNNAGSVHGGDGGIGILPRSLFTTLRFTL